MLSSKGVSHAHAPTVASTQAGTIQAVKGFQPPDLFESAAKEDPLGLLQRVQRDVLGDITDYTCTFTKQERLKGVLGPEEVIQVLCREQPFSVLMEWVRNPSHCDRVLYVKNKWTSRSGGAEAWVDPHGAIVDVVLGRRGGIRYDIQKAVREGKTLRAVDMFGFVNMLERIVTISTQASRRGDLTLTYRGKSRIADRDTYLFERTLPYSGPNGGYPDRVLLVHLDRALRVPVGMFSYADDDRTQLISSYVISDIVLNPGLTDTVFSKESNGF
jgi:hypothetical protein